ncbi:unnamed protein product, partial [Discosporangium mesarthrocarpum]
KIKVSHSTKKVWQPGDMAASGGERGAVLDSTASPSQLSVPIEVEVLPARRVEGPASVGVQPTSKVTMGSGVVDNIRGKAQPILAKRRQRIFTIGRTTKWVTREMAALDFLMDIPMRNEQAIRLQASRLALGVAGNGDLGGGGEDRTGNRTPESLTDEEGLSESELLLNRIKGEGPMEHPAKARPHRASNDSNSDSDVLDQPVAGKMEAVGRGGRVRHRGGGINSPAPGRRLQGRSAVHVRVPANIRHRQDRMPGPDAAEVRQWEQRLTQQERLLEGRLFLSCSKGYPVSIATVLRYQPEEEEARRVRQKWIDERGAEAFQVPRRDWRGFSYAHLLQNRCTGGVGVGVPQGATVGAPVAVGSVAHGSSGADGEGHAPPEEELLYEPGHLDDPEMVSGKHRHVMCGDRNTGPVMSSVLLFVKPRDLKDDLNAQFRERHPTLPPSLTLSKIRSVKRQALLGCHRAGVEVATVALACTYFERLCLRGLVTKPNRQVSMAACLAIAFKFNEPMLAEGVSKLQRLWAFIDQEWQVSKKQVLEAEFGVLVQLSFSLHEEPRTVSYHFTQLLKIIESSPSMYLGDEMLNMHKEAILSFYCTDSGGESEG